MKCKNLNVDYNVYAAWPPKESVKWNRTLFIMVHLQSQESEMMHNFPCTMHSIRGDPLKLLSRCANRYKDVRQPDINDDANGKRTWERCRCALLLVSAPRRGLVQLRGWSAELSLINYNHPVPTTILIVLRQNNSNQEILDMLLELRTSCKPGPVRKGGSWNKWWKNSE